MARPRGNGNHRGCSRRLLRRFLMPAVLGLGAIDDKFQPGRVGPEAGEQALQPGIVVAVADDFFHGVLQGEQAGVAGVLNDDLDSAGGAEAFHRRSAEDIHQPVAGELQHELPGQRGHYRVRLRQA